MLLYEKETYEIRKAIFEVYKAMGIGFLEAVYHECLQIEFDRLKIPYTYEERLKIKYKNIELKHKYYADFICYNKILLEIKSKNILVEKDESQLLNYMYATGIKVGLLVNFGSYPEAEIKRMVL
jgi:GxxExxY protein